MRHDRLSSAVDDSPGSQKSQGMVLQSLLWPEQGVITEHPMFYRLTGPAAFSDDRNEIHFGADGHASFDTAANLFNIGKWWRSAKIEDLHLRLTGAGRFELVVFQVIPDRSWEQLAHRIVTLAPDCDIDLSHFQRLPVAGVLFFTLKALDSGHLADACWLTHQQPRQLPQIALSITTFKREDAVQKTVARFKAFMTRTTLAPHLHLIVVDNGQSAAITVSDHVTPLPNRNLGGSGGFARGLAEAETRGATHCIFMDDDASIPLGAIERVWAFLAFAEDPGTAVSGALAMANHRWAIWESGATFNRRCHPQWSGTDMRDFGQVLRMEIETTRPQPQNFYGGWWFFAFPIAYLRHRPFPFFVRGDDISFSLANKFNIFTLPGVVCFQDADFSDKESLHTLYLDLRSHLIHHLALPDLDIGRLPTIGVAASFFVQSLLQCHYETQQALILAVQDVLHGPDFFAENADMSNRRATLTRLRQTEAWNPIQTALPRSRIRINLHGPGWRARFWRLALNLSLNGYFLPFFGYWGNHITLRAGQRGDVGAHWGAARITYISSDGSQSFTVQHSKWRALAQAVQMAQSLMKLALGYNAIKSRWQSSYPTLASAEFWSDQFKTAPLDAPPSTNGKGTHP